MTDNATKVFMFLVENREEDYTAAEVAKELGLSINAVTGSMNGFVKQGLAFREEVFLEDAFNRPQFAKYLRITEEGLRYYIKIWEEDIKLKNETTPTFTSIVDDSYKQYRVTYNKKEKFFDGKTSSVKIADTEYITTLPNLAVCMAQANILRSQKDVCNIAIYMYNQVTGEKQLVTKVDGNQDVANLPKPESFTTNYSANHTHSLTTTSTLYTPKGSGAATYVEQIATTEPRDSKLKMQLANCREEVTQTHRELEYLKQKYQNAVPMDFAEKVLQEAVIETMQGTAASVMEMFDDGWDIETIYKILGEIAQGKYEPPAYINNRQRLFPPSEETIQDKLNIPK